jgi:hypothetical protein
VLLSTSLVPPSALGAPAGCGARSRRADAGGVGHREDSPETLATALDGARLLVIDAPHLSVTQAAAERFGDTVIAQQHDALRGGRRIRAWSPKGSCRRRRPSLQSAASMRRGRKAPARVLALFRRRRTCARR